MVCVDRDHVFLYATRVKGQADLRLERDTRAESTDTIEEPFGEGGVVGRGPATVLVEPFVGDDERPQRGSTRIGKAGDNVH